MSIRWIAVMLANICFFALTGVQGLLIALLNLILVYISGIALERKTKYKKLLCGSYVLLQLGLLFVFKYELIKGIMTPLAISFYTLVCYSYVIDVCRGKYAAQKNIIKLAAVLFFFPAMAQGPIYRYDDIKEQIENAKFEFRRLSYGLTRIFYGLFKKLVIAERLSIAFEYLGGTEGGTAVALNIFVYAFYLYSDFSGGIDIAIGIGKVLGIELPENFNNPFLAGSIAEYWRRWHISLGMWLRDYVFYPISFSGGVVKLSKTVKRRVGYKASKKVPIYIATVVTWFVTGIWHGVRSNFILWGMLNGVIILVSMELEPLYKRFTDGCSFAKSGIYKAFKILRTFILMGILRMLDYNTVQGYIKALRLMITDFSVAEFGLLPKAFMSNADMCVIIIGVLVMLIVGICKEKANYDKLIFNRGVVFTYSIIAVLIVAVIIFGMYGIGYEGKDFIYLRY